MNSVARQHTFAAWILIVALLLIYFLSRTYHVMAVPPFLDEGEIISYAKDARQGELWSGGNNARLIPGWWVALFQADGYPAAWLNRMAIIILSLLSVAAIYSTAKIFAGKWAGFLALLFYLLMPFAFFHDRLGLSDPYTSVFGALCLWFAARYTKRQRPMDAVFSGLMLTAAILAKATGIMLVVAPGIVFISLLSVGAPLTSLLSRNKALLRGLGAAYAAFALTWIPVYLYLRLNGMNFFGIPTSAVGTSDLSGVFNRLIPNLGTLWEMEGLYLSVPFVVLALGLAGYLIVRWWRAGLALVAVTILPILGLLAFGTKISGRYLMFHLPFLAICLGVALCILTNDLSRRLQFRLCLARAVPISLIAVWAIAFAVPFAFTMYTDPISQPIPEQDRWEYFGDFASGYGISQAANFLIHQQANQQQPIHVIGLIRNCGSLEWQIPANLGISVDCPPLYIDGSHQAQVGMLVNRQAFEAKAESFDLWIIYEVFDNITLDGIAVPYREVISFDRLRGVTHVRLYHIHTTP